MDFSSLAERRVIDSSAFDSNWRGEERREGGGGRGGEGGREGGGGERKREKL